MKRWSQVFLPLLIGLASPCAAVDSPSFRFASPQEARAVLAARDEFVERLSPFDRAARLKSAADVSESRFLQFVGENVLAWEQGVDRKRVSDALDSVSGRLAELGIALPGNILVARTTGREEGGAAYTRGHVIVLPDAVLADPKQDLIKLIAHETFHILSRSSEALRTRAYKAIGFTSCPDFRFPPALLDRKITNPDAPRNDHCIEVRYQGDAVRATPILFASAPAYDAAKGGEFFEYLQFKLALLSDAEPRIVDVGDVEGFFEQVGRNTQYIIHPEEILADNFALNFVKAAKMQTQAIPAAVLEAVRADSPARSVKPVGHM